MVCRQVRGRLGNMMNPQEVRMRRFNISTAMFRSFLEIAKEGSVTRAADRLNSTQSTLSHQIHKLEIQLGRPLFHRRHRIMERTPAGDYFYAQARKIVDAMDEIDLFFGATKKQQSVSIGIVNDCFRPSIIKSLYAFYRDFPLVTVDFRTGSSEKLTRQVQNGEVELAIVRDVSDSPTVGHVLWSEQLLWAAGPAYRHGDGPLPMVFMPSPCVYRRYAVDLFAAKNIPYEVAVECTSWSMFESSLRAGAGISLVTSDVIKVCGVGITDPRLPPAPTSHACLVAGEMAEGSATWSLAERLKNTDDHMSAVDGEIASQAAFRTAHAEGSSLPQ